MKVWMMGKTSTTFKTGAIALLLVTVMMRLNLIACWGVNLAHARRKLNVFSKGVFQLLKAQNSSVLTSAGKLIAN